MEKLTDNQVRWLYAMAKAIRGAVSVTQDKPPTALMRRLERRGYCKDVMGTFWYITDAGREYLRQLENS